MYYAFESVMLNEFVSRGYQCSTQDIVPRGPAYNDTAFQACAVQSSIPGDLVVSGQSYLENVYDFYQSNLWRDVGINAGFFGFFSICVAYVSLYSLIWSNGTTNRLKDWNGEIQNARGPSVHYLLQHRHSAKKSKPKFFFGIG
jgi:ABC-type multidrug transport system permease subunit